MTTAIPLDDDIATTTNDLLSCPVCAKEFRRVRRQRFCCPNCRKTAWARSRKAQPVPVALVPPPGRRREQTVYRCPVCENLYLGLQWCDDCARPCVRIGLGGSCPHCCEPVALADLCDITEGTDQR